MESIGFHREILKQYTTQAFKPSRELLQSYWYLKRSDKHIEVTHAPSHLLLALAATDPDEEAARAKVMSRYDDEIEGLKAFAKVNVRAKKMGISVDALVEQELAVAA